MSKVTINKEQALYVIPAGNGFTCLGFNVAFSWALAYFKELGDRGLVPAAELANYEPKLASVGTLAGYDEYRNLVDLAQRVYRDSGARLEAGLTPQLKGLEGRLVEVVDCYGEKRRFRVGKSTGWIPCHLELASARSSGGGAVTGTPFKSVRVIK